MTLDDFARLVEETGPLDENIMAVLRGADDRYAFVVGETETVVGVEFLADMDRCVLHVDIGRPDADSAAAVHRALLTLAANWRATGGLAVAMPGGDGGLALTYGLTASTMTPRDLAILAVNMAVRGAALERVIAEGALAAETPDSPPPGGDFDQFMVRA